jgi:hypothetical protein
VIIGLVSTNPPTILEADVGLNNGSNLVAGAFGPSVGGQAIACDFTGLAQAIDTLRLSDLVAPNDRARAGRHGALRNLVAAATEAAEAGDREDALEAVNALARRIGADKNPWVTEEAAARLEPILDELTSCLESHPPTPNGDNHDGEDNEDDSGRPDKPGKSNGSPKHSGKK